MEIGSQGLEDCESARGGFQRGQNLRRQLAHAARAEGQDQVAFARLAATAATAAANSGANSTCGP